MEKNTALCRLIDVTTIHNVIVCECGGARTFQHDYLEGLRLGQPHVVILVPCQRLPHSRLRDLHLCLRELGSRGLELIRNQGLGFCPCSSPVISGRIGHLTAGYEFCFLNGYLVPRPYVSLVQHFKGHGQTALCVVAESTVALAVSITVSVYLYLRQLVHCTDCYYAHLL